MLRFWEGIHVMYIKSVFGQLHQPTPKIIPKIDSQKIAPPTNTRIIPVYIGCLTTPYNPWDITFCFLSDCILRTGAKNVFWTNDPKKKNSPGNRARNPIHLIPVNNGMDAIIDSDHLYRFESSGMRIFIEKHNAKSILCTHLSAEASVIFCRSFNSTGSNT